MWYKKTFMTAVAIFIAAFAFTAKQAYALNDDEAAILVGLAVGTVAAVATKHHRDHDRHDWEYRQHNNYRPRAEYHRDDYPRYRRPPQRVEHYVIHNPPARHHYGPHCKYPGKKRGHHYDRRVGYEYEYRSRKHVNF